MLPPGFDPSSVRAIATDLDGTILDGVTFRPSQRTVNAIRAVEASGILVFLATGRMLQSAKRIAAMLDLHTPVICYQGALVADPDTGEVLFHRPLEVEPKALALLTPETRALIGQLRIALEAVTDWSAETTEAAMRNFAEQNNLKLGGVAQPLRVALTGRTTSPGIFDVLAVLGRDQCLARLADQAAG